MLKHVVFLNGSPRSGKDTFAEIAIDLFGDKVRMATTKFAQPLRDAVCALFDLKNEEVELWKTNLVGGFANEEGETYYTGRDVMIALSEQVVKPMLDRGFFARRAAETALNSNAEIVIVTDAGFDYEVAAFIDAVNWGAICKFSLVHIHREGCTFEGDSRNYIGLNDDIAYHAVVNTTIPEFTKSVESIMSEIVLEPGYV